MKKISAISFTLIFWGIVSFAQSSGNHLLWRISGNGLSKPSYLFGTMHLTDKRLFHFGDSLYRALEQTEGFAAELDFNAVLGEYIDKMIEERQASRYLKDQLDPAFIKKNRPVLEKKFRKRVDEITLSDLKKLESRKRNDLLNSGEMDAFMDAYLFGLADKQGKWVGGIEDPEDQLGLDELTGLDSRLNSIIHDEASEKKQLEWMIRVYLDENLDQIDRSSRLWKGARDILLIKRNFKMAFRMDSLAHVRSNLFAVGAAHLPGDSGVIALLRDKGFTLTPVISSKRINPSDYTFTEVKKPWVDVWPKDSLYMVQMPLQPKPLKAIAGGLFDMLFLYDPISSTAYFTASIPIGNISPDRKDTVVKNMISYYRKSASEFSEKEINVADQQGKELSSSSDDGIMRMQIFVPGNYVVINLVSGLKEESLFTDKANYFFSSFRPDTARAGQLARMQQAGWQEASFPSEGFTVMTPVAMKLTAAQLPEGSIWNRNMYFAIDPASGSYNAVVSDAIHPGYYTQNDTVFFKQSEDGVINNLKGTLISSRAFTFDGLPAHESVITVEKSGILLYTKLYFISRGNRRYTVYKTYDPKSEKGDPDQFFRSFRFLPVATSDWRPAISSAGFSTVAPQLNFSVDTTEAGDLLFSQYDSLSATTFSVLKHVLPKYYWYRDDSSLLASSMKINVGSDSVISKTNVRNGVSKGLDLLIHMKTSRLLKKMRIIVDADTLYIVYSFIPAEVLNTANGKRFFEEFRSLNDGRPSTIFGNNTQRLLDALHSKDSAAFELAKSSITAAPFEINDLPALHSAILQQYADHDSLSFDWGYSVSSKLAQRAVSLDTAGSTVAFVKEHFSRLSGDSSHLRYVLLHMLSERKTMESYMMLRDLFKEPLPRMLTYFRLRGLEDSLALSSHLFPNAFRLFDEPLLRYQMSSLATTLLDSGYITRQMISDNEDLLMRVAAEPLHLDRSALAETSYQYMYLPGLIQPLNNPEGNSLLRKLGKVDASEINIRAWRALLQNKQPVSTTDLLPLAKQDEYRNSLHAELESIGRTDLFPKMFLTQKLFGQSEVFGMAYDDEKPESVVYVKEKIADWKGAKRRFYFYKVTMEESDESYLGVAGPYSLDGKDIRTDHYVTNIFWDEEFDVKRIDSLFNDYLRELLEARESEDDVE